MPATLHKILAMGFWFFTAAVIEHLKPRVVVMGSLKE